MIKLFKYLKPFIILIMGIIALLFVQATADLSLPEYMSKIVNTGIGQNGIENAVPNVIRKTELEKITLFLNDADKKYVVSKYKLLDNKDTNNIEKYPLLKKEALYELNTAKKDDIKKLDKIFVKPILIVYGVNKKNMVINSYIPKAQIEMIKKQALVQIDKLPDTMHKGGAANYIKDEYKIAGLNVANIQTNYILISGLKMLGLALISVVATIFVGFLAAKVAAGFGRNLRKIVFRKVTNFSSAEFDKYGSSSLIVRTTNDINQIQMLMVMFLRIVFYAPILGVGGFLKVLNTNTSMGWIVGLALGSIAVVMTTMFVFAIPKFKLLQKLIDRINLVAREALSGIMVIRAFNTQKDEEAKFNKANVDLTKTNLFITRTMLTMMPIMMLIMNCVVILIVWVGSHEIDKGAIQVGDMMAFIQYTMQILMAFIMITMVSIMLPRASVSASRIGEVLSTKSTVKDPDNKKSFDSKKKGNVEFKNVSFKYPGAEDYVISNISFTAKPGETTAFIGSTGSGKSTIINLIPRFYDVSEGSILIDDIDIRDVSQYDLREKIGYVPQKGILFKGTIKSNLEYGKEKSSSKDLEKAASIAQSLDFINNKDHKFNSEISQGGTNVSGGQKQRLSIARALIKKPQIYIFDDTFSALDYKTDAKLRDALKHEVKESTVLIVAQRIGTIMNADQIIVLEEGKIVGIGKHQELMKTCKVYQEIGLSQLSKEELNNE